MTLESVDRALLVDQVYANLRAAIVAGEFPSGAQLVERDLATQLGVSRVPVRDALRRLGDEGLLVDLPHRGRFVRTFTPDDVADLYNLRLALEPAAVRLMIRVGSSVRPLEAALDQMREAEARGDVGTLNALELAFHQAICDLSGNTRLSAGFAAVAGQVLLAMSMDNVIYAHEASIADEHVPILDAIRAGDEERAAGVLSKHIVGTVGQLLDAVGATPETRSKLLIPAGERL